jgi:4-amino-4-deoxy-L-arabinose transferase-like glycosyltransferase
LVHQLLGANVMAWRLSSVVAVWLAAVPLYFLVRDTLGKRTAWIALAFYMISPWVLTYARMGYNASQGILPVGLSLALAWLAVRRDSRFYAFLAGGAAGLSLFAPETARIAIVLAPLWLVWMWISRQVGGKMIGRQLAAVVVGIVAVAAPPIVYGLTHAPDAYLGKQFESSNNVFYARDFSHRAVVRVVWTDRSGTTANLLRSAILRATHWTRRDHPALAFHLAAVVRENFLVDRWYDPFGILFDWAGVEHDAPASSGYADLAGVAAAGDSWQAR